MQLTSSLSKLLFATMATLFLAVNLLLSGIQTTGHPRRSFIRRPTISSLLESTPEPRRRHTAIWTGREMIIWGGITANGISPSGSRYDPVTDSWAAMADAPIGLFGHTAIWTGTEMIVWGGGSADSSVTNEGARYDPATDSWFLTITAGAPDPRTLHTVVWTGTEMIVWGGQTSDGHTNTGGRYDPITDSWIPTSTRRAASRRRNHFAVWTGQEMIVWGGYDRSNIESLTTGGRYNPVADRWSSMRRATNAPDITKCAVGVWTGNLVLVAGLKQALTYDPATNRWTSVNAPPENICSALAVWTDTEMMIWQGGIGQIPDMGRGFRYHPATDSWSSIPMAGAPSPRLAYSTVWTGVEMIVWGGLSFPPELKQLNTGARYNPVDDSWTPTSVE